MAEARRLELLAPARDLSAGRKAILHGADAVYIGPSRFGARAAAGNSVEEIGALAAFAHRYRARVYVTLNTILYDDELEAARQLAHDVWNAGADAIIIQDMGLLELDLPPIPLFASTQAHNTDPARIRFLEQVGIRRVILARELTLAEIGEIRKETSVELEAFVHGALCVSYSGQCYMSFAITGRSANRGECAQMCRLPYTLHDRRGNILVRDRHLLSLKDLDLSSHLGELLDAGITSFKIEGRLKDEAYVSNVTAFYRAQLDALLEKRAGFRRASSGRTMFSFAPDPERTFHRSGTEYFLRGRRRGIIELRTPKSLGKFLGRVAEVGRSTFTLDRPSELHNGDGICFFTGGDDLRGIQVNSVENGKVRPDSLDGIGVGTVIYRNFDREFLRAIEAGGSERKIGVALTLSETPEGFRLAGTDEDGVAAAVEICHPKEDARDPEKAAQAVSAQLAKMGGTIFRLSEWRSELASPRFIPVAVLNGLRRGLLTRLESERIATFPREEYRIIPTHHPYPTKLLDRYANVVNRKAEAFYRRHGVEELERGVELQEDLSGTILMTTRHCLKFELGLCGGKATEAEELYLTNGSGRYRVEFDCETCQMKIVSPAYKAAPIQKETTPFRGSPGSM